MDEFGSEGVEGVVAVQKAPDLKTNLERETEEGSLRVFDVPCRAVSANRTVRRLGEYFCSFTAAAAALLSAAALGFFCVGAVNTVWFAACF